MKEDGEPQISNVSAICLVAVSLFFDVINLILSFIPVIGWIVIILVNIFAGLTFYVWFKILGVSFFSTRRWLSFASGFILGAFPFISALAWTIDVVLVIATIRAEEKLQKISPTVAKAASVAKSAVAGRSRPNNIIRGNFNSPQNNQPRQVPQQTRREPPEYDRGKKAA